MSADLVAWMKFQIDVDERLAQRAESESFVVQGDGGGAVTEFLFTQLSDSRALAEVTAKRAIIDRYEFVSSHGPAVDHTRAMDMTTGAEAALRDVVRMLAQVYCDRAGFDSSWLD